MQAVDGFLAELDAHDAPNVVLETVAELRFGLGRDLNGFDGVTRIDVCIGVLVAKSVAGDYGEDGQDTGYDTHANYICKPVAKL